MPYYPPQENLNRIDEIKKRFEEAEKKHEKPVIKRTPAFRCDRIVCGKNVINVSPKNKSSWASAQSDSEVKTTGRKISSDSSSSLSEGLQKSLSENNLLKQPGNQDYIVKVISQRKNILAKNEEYSKLLAEYAVVNKKKNNNQSVKELDPIVLALQSPLPPGPPPKKPPRLFTHTPQKNVAKNDTRLKLEKLENFILKNDKKCHVIVPRKQDSVRASIEKENSQCGLSCLSVCIDKENVYMSKSEDGSKKKNVTRSPSGETDGHSKNDVALNEHEEPIYAQPYLHNGTPPGSATGERTASSRSSFNTFGKPTGVTTTPIKSPTSNNASPLHYMCTDLSQPTLDWMQAETLPLDKYQIKSSPVSSRFSQSPPKNNGPTKISQSPFKTGFHDKKQDNCFSKPFVVPSAVGVVAQRVSLLAGTPIHRTAPSPPSPSTDGDTSPQQQLRNVRLIMNKAFGPPMPDAVSLDSEEEALDDTFSTDRKSNNPSPASSPSLKSISSNTDIESLKQLTAKRKIYVKRVSSHLVSADKQATFHLRQDSKASSHLFESCLLIGLTLSDEPNGPKKNLPYVKTFFPPHVQPPPLIEFFCFPDADAAWPPPKSRQTPEEQSYSIVLTNERGERKFGYCRRVLPEGENFCLPLAYCIISTYRATGFYYTVLKELETRHGSPELNGLMQLLYDTEFPHLGQSLQLQKILQRVKLSSSPEDAMISTLRRPSDIRLENRDVTQLFSHLSISVILKVFSSVLLERRVILLGNSLSTLSSCIEALQSILYPFSWQHTILPVLPAHLLELCDAPLPYIIGVLKQTESIEATLAANFSEGIMVDIEEDRVICSCKDENSILPRNLRRSLRSALTSGSNTNSKSDVEKNLIVSEAFLRFFVEICGHYSKHLLPQQDGTLAFERETFIKSVNSASKRNFLEWFTETAMFHAFIQDREDFDVQDLFSSQSIRHSAEMENNLIPFKTNNKKGKTVVDRLKDLTTFSK